VEWGGCCAEVTERSFTAAEPLSDEQNATMNLALFIVVPIFLACYCGSCLAYVVYKIYRNCCRDQHAKARTVDLEAIETPGAHRPCPAAYPTYLHAPGQPLPPPVKPDAPSRYIKAPPSYETEFTATGGAPDDHSDDGAGGGVPIAEILMKKVAQKSSVTAF